MNHVWSDKLAAPVLEFAEHRWLYCAVAVSCWEDNFRDQAFHVTLAQFPNGLFYVLYGQLLQNCRRAR
jgi:hypothetical protein